MLLPPFVFRTREVAMFIRGSSPLAGLYAYSNRFLETMDEGHGIGSPLGAWSLLAMLAHDAPASLRSDLEAVLGCDAEEAFVFVMSLLELQHPAVALAFGAWIHGRAQTPAWTDWQAQLPPVIARGPIPTQASADAWMSEATRGQITRLPLDINPLTAALLASGVAMDGRWETPFKVSAPGELGPHEFDHDVERVLVRTDMRHAALVRTATAGIVGALVQVATEAYAVISVVPPEGVSRATAIAAAHEVAAMWEEFDHRSNVSLFDLPLGSGPDWSIEETEFEDLFGPTRRERSTVYIPAWDVEQPKIDLLGHRGYGFLAAIPLFEARLKTGRGGLRLRGRAVREGAIPSIRLHRGGRNRVHGSLRGVARQAPSLHRAAPQAPVPPPVRRRRGGEVAAPVPAHERNPGPASPGSAPVGRRALLQCVGHAAH
jgi:hypothetical protein